MVFWTSLFDLDRHLDTSPRRHNVVVNIVLLIKVHPKMLTIAKSLLIQMKTSWFWHCVKALMMLKSMCTMDFREHFSVILFLTSKFDFHNILQLIFNANFGIGLLTPARNFKK